jgi:hypothetical protein
MKVICASNRYKSDYLGGHRMLMNSLVTRYHLSYNLIIYVV